MKNLMLSAAALALLAGCGNGGGGDAADGSNTSAVERVRGEDPIRLASGDPAKAEDALAALFVSDTDDTISFESKDVDGAKAVYKNLTFTIDADDIEDTLSELGEDGDEITVEADTAVINVGELVFQGLDVNDDGQALFSGMTLNNLSANDEDGEGAFGIANITLENPTPEVAAWVSSILKQGEPAEFPALENVAFDRFQITGMSLSGEDESGSGVVSVDSVTMRNVGDLLVGRTSIEGMNVDFNDLEEGVAGKITLGSLTTLGAKLDLPKAIADNIDDEEAMMSALMSATSQNPIDPGYDKVEMNDLDVDIAGLKIAAPKWLFEIDRDDNGQVKTATMDTFSMTIAADADAGEAGAQIAPFLGMMGFETIEISGESLVNYDAENDIATSPTGYLDIKDAVRISSTSKVEGYKAYGDALANMNFSEILDDNADPDAVGQEMLSAYQQLSVHDLSLTIDDNGLVDKILTVVSAQTGETPEALKQQAVFGLTMGSAMAGGTGVDPNLVQEAVTAVTNFINNPGELTISLSPETPLTMNDFMDPTLITKERLGFSASAE